MTNFIRPRVMTPADASRIIRSAELQAQRNALNQTFRVPSPPGVESIPPRQRFGLEQANRVIRNAELRANRQALEQTLRSPSASSPATPRPSGRAGSNTTGGRNPFSSLGQAGRRQVQGVVKPVARFASSPSGRAIGTNTGVMVAINAVYGLASGQSPRQVVQGAALTTLGGFAGGIIGSFGGPGGAALGAQAGSLILPALANWLLPPAESPDSPTQQPGGAPISLTDYPNLGQTPQGTLAPLDWDTPDGSPAIPNEPVPSDPEDPESPTYIPTEPQEIWVEGILTDWDDRTGERTYPISGRTYTPLMGISLEVERYSQSGNVKNYGSVTARFVDGTLTGGANQIWGSSNVFGGAVQWTLTRLFRVRPDGTEENVPFPTSPLSRPRPTPIPQEFPPERGGGRPFPFPQPAEPETPAPVPEGVPSPPPIPDIGDVPQKVPKGVPKEGDAPKQDPLDYKPVPGRPEANWAKTGDATSANGAVRQEVYRGENGEVWKKTTVVQQNGAVVEGIQLGQALGVGAASVGLGVGIATYNQRKQQQLPKAAPRGVGQPAPSGYSPAEPNKTPPPTSTQSPCNCNKPVLARLDNLAAGNATGQGLSLAALLAKLQEIANAIGVSAFPASVPGNLANPASGTKQLNNLASMHLWQTEQIDGLLGQFPNSTRVETPDGQQIDLESPNVSESLAEIQGMLISLMVSNSEILHTSTRTLQQAGSATQQAHLAGLIARGNADFLGYEARQTAANIPMSYTPGGLPFQGLLSESQQNMRGWENSDGQDLKSILAELLQAAAIIRAVYWRKLSADSDYSQQVKDNIRSKGRFVDEQGTNTDSDWEEYLRSVEGGFLGTDTPYDRPANQAPKIRDRSPNTDNPEGT